METRLHAHPRQRRETNLPWGIALVLVVGLFLAGCGSSGVTLPSEEGLEEGPVGEAPASTTALTVEAEAGVSTQGFAQSFEFGNDEAASGGGYISQPTEIGDLSSGLSVADFEFSLSEADAYDLWVRVFAPSSASDATYLGFNGETRRLFAPETGRYLWVHVTTASLAATRHVISLGHGEPGLRIDLFAVVRHQEFDALELENLVQPSSETIPTPTDPDPEPAPKDPTPLFPSQPTRDSFSLRGDEDFSTSDLTATERLWFDRTWTAVNASSPSMVSIAKRDDDYYYGRTLFQYSTAVLLGLRSTGDLAFLDALDPMMQALRGELHDGWCGGVESSVYVNSMYGTVSEHDGFRNFRFRYEPGRDNCRDTGDLNETLTHGHLAMVMYAYHANRDLVSPAGVDYGERADFWFEYLRDDFEAKWRGRSGVAWPAMDFIDLKYSHTYNVFSLYYYFMGLRLVSEGNPDGDAYLAEAAALTDAMFDQRYIPGERAGGFVQVSGPTGDAVVYSFGAPRRGTVTETHLQASPMTYSRYVMSAWLTLRLEGWARWDDAAMMRVANGLTGFVLDLPSVSSTDDSIAASVTGESTVGGIPPTTFRSRMSITKWAETSLSAFAVWDASGRIEEVSLQTYDLVESNESQPSSAFIPASMLFVESATGRDLGVTASR